MSSDCDDQVFSPVRSIDMQAYANSARVMDTLLIPLLLSFTVPQHLSLSVKQPTQRITKEEDGVNRYRSARLKPL